MPTTLPLGAPAFFIDTANPGATDDSGTIGARRGYWWLNTSDNSVHICINSTTGSAIWQEVTPNTRTISAGTGLTGGGTLDADRTLSIASTAVSTGTYGSASLIPIFTVNAQGQLTNATTTAVNTTTLGAVPTSRTITAGTGLTGGGDLSANRTIPLASSGVVAATYGSAAAAVTLTINGQGQITSATTTAVSAGSIGAVPTTRTITAGTGLVGGGDLSADRTFALTGVAERLHTYSDGPGTSPAEIPRNSDLGTAAFADIYSIGGIFAVSQTSNYTATLSDFRKIIIATASTLTFTLPLAADVPYGWFCLMKNRSGNGLTIARSGSDTLNSGLTSVSIASSSAVNFVVKTSNTTFEVG